MQERERERERERGNGDDDDERRSKKVFFVIFHLMHFRLIIKQKNAVLCIFALSDFIAATTHRWRQQRRNVESVAKLINILRS